MTLFDKDKEQAPYMAVVGAYRTSTGGGGVPMFDSETRHQHIITLRIRTASRRRDLSRDWIHGEEELIEVAMTEAQWAQFVSSLNMGDGVPCTMTYRAGDHPDRPLPSGSIPGPTLPDNKVDQFHDEMLERMEKAIKKLNALKEAPGINAKRKKEIELILQELDSNMGFVADQFSEHMEHYVSKAKTEVEAYMMAAIHRAGLSALLGKEGTPKIEDHSKEDDDGDG